MLKNIRKKRRNTIKKYQEYDRREVGCESCGCKVKKCNWLWRLETKEHRDGVENGGGGGDMGGEGEGAGGRSWIDHHALLLLILCTDVYVYIWYSVIMYCMYIFFLITIAFFPHNHCSFPFAYFAVWGEVNHVDGYLKPRLGRRPGGMGPQDRSDRLSCLFCSFVVLWVFPKIMVPPNHPF